MGKSMKTRTMLKLILVTFVLLSSKSVSSFDLLSTLMNQGSLPNLKSLVSPELLKKMKGMLPSNAGEADISQIEKILGKLKPVEGRFDPAVLELLANMDSRVSLPKTPAPNFRRKVTAQPPLEHTEAGDYPFLPTSTTAAMRETTVDDKPKFSSKFRISEHKTVDNTPPSIHDDPNLRNHRLYDVEPERFETYENFTKLDQAEDLIADESFPHPMIATSERPKAPVTQPASATSTSGWVGKPYYPHSKKHMMDSEQFPSTSASYEDLISFESLEEESQITDREQLKGSTERTVMYGSSSNKPHNDNDGPFKPSPLDLSQQMHFEPGQEFYTTTIKSKRAKNVKPRRRQEAMTGHNHKFDSYIDHDDYEKEQPSYQHVVDYMRLQNQPTESSTPQQQQQINHPHQYLHRPQTNYMQQQTPNPTHPHPHQGMPQGVTQYPHMSGPTMKQDRILNPALSGPGPLPFPAASAAPNSVVYPDNSYPYQKANVKNYVPAASENVYQDVQNSYQQPQDLTHSAGQNYYHSNHGHQHGHAGYGHGYGHGGPHHHVEEGSTWSTTFLVLGGLIALSAVVAFFLPSFLASSAVSGGKDTGGDKNANSDADLWAEIKGLYTDIVSIAKGDYSHFHRPNPNDLPKIHIVEVDEETTTPNNSNVINRRKGEGEPTGAVSSEESNYSTSAQDVQDDEAVMDIVLKQESKGKRKKHVNINDTLAFGVYKDATTIGKSNGLNFANAFNQTLNAWEKVPLIAN